MATKAGVEALAAYHERRDPVRKVGLGPEHDRSSHAADAFGLMCLAYEEPPARTSMASARCWLILTTSIQTRRSALFDRHPVQL